MWELARPASRGGISLRSIITFAIAVIMTAFLWAIFASSTTHAADAHWDGDTIRYQPGTTLNANQYTSLGKAPANRYPGIAQDSIVYQFLPGGTPQKAYIIYFAPGVDPTKTTGDTAAKYVEYLFTPPDTYTSPANQKDITVESPDSLVSQTSSCIVDGVGWIICPVSTFLAKTMDTVFDFIASFVQVRPAETTQTGPLYIAWNLMRTFANVAFIIAFLIIIYSQVTSIGISNYSIKKLLPRLIIAAILVNISYYICSLAIDLSNILGFSIQDLLNGIRQNIFKVGSGTYNGELFSWQSWTAAILSGSAAGLAGAVGFFGTAGGSIAALVYLLIPVLLGLLVALFVVFLILAARQALITLLVIVAPLAFVAYLLPNTEKWFEKWRELFTTMIVFFPAFSLVFGGSQLAAAVIIQNANSFNVVFLGMCVQVAPLVITPLLLRLSGNVISRIAGLINNPKRGLLDGTKNWANSHADVHKARILGSNRNPLHRLNLARLNDHGRRVREGKKANYEAARDNMWHESRAYDRIDTRKRTLEREKQIIEHHHDLHWNNRANTSSQWLEQEMLLRRTADQVAESKSSLDNSYAEIKAGQQHTGPIAISNATITAAAMTAEGVAIQGMRGQAAKNMEQQQLANALEASVALRNQAGGIDPNGAQRALAQSTEIIRKAHVEAVTNAASLITRGNLTDTMVRELALGHAQTGTNGRVIEATDDVREAAISRVAGGGNVAEILRLVESMDLTPASNEDHRLALTEALKKNSSRPKFYGFGWMSQLEQGVPGNVGQGGVDQAVVSTVNQKKMATEVLVSQDKDALRRVVDTFGRTPFASFDATSLSNLKKQIVDAYLSDGYKERVAERDDELRDMIRFLDRSGITYTSEATDRPKTSL